jgi:hypothetical protein
MRHGLIALLTLFVLAHSAAAGAQTGTRPLWTASGTAGLGQTWDDESSLGRGLFLGGQVERRLKHGLSFECGVDWLSHQRGYGAFQADGHMTVVGAALKYSWSGTAASSYVGGGFGIARYSGSTRFEGVERSNHANLSGPSVGGGVSFSLRNGWRLGPEARLLLLSPTTDEMPALAIVGGVRVAFPIGGH